MVNLSPDQYVVSSKALFRPTKTGELIGDTTKARTSFGFDPQVKFKRLVKLMVEADLEAERQA